jgi:hypothetical protein
VWAFAAAVAAALGAIAVAIARYPAMLTDRQAGVWIAILAVVATAYLAVTAVAALRPTTATSPTGVWFGLAAGAAWVGEIWFQAPARLPDRLEGPVAGAFVLAALIITLAAGSVEGARTRRRDRVLLTGAWTGLVSGSVAASGIVAIQLTHVDLLGARSDYGRELTRSGYPDMATYLASDAVAASLMHMILNVVFGLLGAGVGLLVASARMRGPVEIAQDGHLG